MVLVLLEAFKGEFAVNVAHRKTTVVRGNALVNDGNGAELVQMPNGHTFIPRGRNVLIPNAPKGMKVLSANRTARLFVVVLVLVSVAVDIQSFNRLLIYI